MTPLVSVIIPTANRPHYLPRAVKSALAGMPPGEVEVIVVPNGPDQSWQKSLQVFANNAAVRVIPITHGNANVARNIGLMNARGNYVRFLDDDDYLYPNAAVEQYKILEKSDADVVSGNVDIVDEMGIRLDIWIQPNIEDFCVAILGPWRACLTTAHVYRTTAVRKITWVPSVTLRQDVHWLFELCTASDLKWKRLSESVGAWVQHPNARVSLASTGDSSGGLTIPARYRDRDKATVKILLSTYRRLAEQDRLTPARQEAVALGLWGCVHSSFFLNPIDWTQVAKTALEIYPDSRPIQPIYAWPGFRHLSPIAIQWLLLPKRWLGYRIRYFRKRNRF
ncbi:Glycosyl transferase family 2 [Ectothiorhodospira magna]|uniref:Glycosyl transferase family 2 n=1 Tax=Ectothiorhodospira magna TaxID=867345 RepID=A0A1H8ZAP4_9GAMM|nr:glycosyltransferase family 2 protein [Ectothiorhodospira magna]SEP61456.1 Glycosyl transferase family 2 [Ectothiorhodospira magna]